MSYNEYSFAKIYAIQSSYTDKIYIGSTLKKHLDTEFKHHLSNYSRHLAGYDTNNNSWEIIQYYDAHIVLLYKVKNCPSIEYLKLVENDIINRNKNICVNK